MKHVPGSLVVVVVTATCLAAIVLPAGGQPIFRNGPVVAGAAGKGMVNLPYRPPAPDAGGNNWYVYQGGWLRHLNNMPVYSEAGMLMINGAQPSANTNSARLEANGELVMENLTATGCTVTRRLLISKDEVYVRFIDIFKNTQAQDQTFSVLYRSSVNFGIQSSQTISDPRRKDVALGTVAMDGQGRSLLELFGGKGSRLVPQVQAQQNNSWIQTTFNLAIPAGKEVAIVHLHAVMPGADAATKIVANLKESKLLADVPRAVRRVVANFAGGNLFIGGSDVEVLRGDVFDAVELRGGDAIKGTITDPAYKLTTFFGPIEFPAARVVGLINVGESRPRQLLVTADGEIYGGRLEQAAVALELTSGQAVNVPLSQVSRLGYRRRAGEPEEWAFDKPMVLLRSGERMCVRVPAGEIAVATRYGLLQLKPQAVQTITLQNEDNGAHLIALTDGSRFAGLLTAGALELQLASGREEPVRFPVGTIARLQLSSKADEADDTAPQLKLTNDDLLVAALAGEYKLETAFGTLSVAGEQVRSITHAKDSPLDVVVRLWDDSSVSGSLPGQELAFQLRSGVAVRVPAALVAEYAQPQPQPSAQIVRRVTEVAGGLGADDFKTRDDAERQLLAMGPAIGPVLKQLRGGASPEARQRLEQILTTLKVPVGPVAPVTPGAGGTPEN